MKCAACDTGLPSPFLDLGKTPLANSYLLESQLEQPEPTFPLSICVCPNCLLVQLNYIADPSNIFQDYAYFSSFSDSWVEHARRYTELMQREYGINQQSKVVEIGSNDGYLLQHFVERDIPVLGIEPAENVAQAARDKGINTKSCFFGVESAKGIVAEQGKAQLILGNNVFAHCPTINDFIGGVKVLLDNDGIATFEFPHLLKLIENHEFDTIYHEHYFYFSILALQTIFSQHGLTLFRVDQLPTHGGSLRIYLKHTNCSKWEITQSVQDVLMLEQSAGLDKLETYNLFSDQVKAVRDKLKHFLKEAKAEGKITAAYGAPAKGNTLLNYCHIGPDDIDYTVDRNPKKQGHVLPGSHIEVYPVEHIFETHPDYILILPWNLKDEIMQDMQAAVSWGAKFVVPIPEVRVLS